jgi:hypothetical protein
LKIPHSLGEIDPETGRAVAWHQKNKDDIALSGNIILIVKKIPDNSSCYKLAFIAQNARARLKAKICLNFWDFQILTLPIAL